MNDQVVAVLGLEQQLSRVDLFFVILENVCYPQTSIVLLKAHEIDVNTGRFLLDAQNGKFTLALRKIFVVPSKHRSFLLAYFI